MNFLEAIAELQKPENIKTKCIRPVAWCDCYDHYILKDFGFGLVLSYRPEDYDPYESNPFYIPYYVDVLTGEWLMCDIPTLPECVEDEE
jgi:hypothetical protein